MRADAVPDDVAGERLARLIDEVRSATRARNLALLGTRHEVLIEKGARRGELLQGRTRDFRTVLVPGDETSIGRYMTVEITGTTGSTFTGRVLDAPSPAADVARATTAPAAPAAPRRQRSPLPLAG